MARYERGCVRYAIAEYTMRVAFPEDMVVCDICPFCHTENSGTRFRCTETGEILPYHNKDIGLKCPLPIVKQSDEREENNYEGI